MVRGSLKEVKQNIEEKELPLITVAVTCYNIKDYLTRAVESVCNQSYRNLEILLVDDGSTDGTEKICDDYAKRDSRIHVIHKKNGGPSEARNTAIEQSNGEYVAFVDGDDWVDENMYENMYLALQKGNADLAVCSYKQVSANHVQDTSTDTILYFEQDEALESFIKEEEEVQIQNAAWNKLFKKELLKELRFPVGKLYEEIVFTTKLLHMAKRVVYLNQCYYNYVVDRVGSIMNTGMNKRIFTDQIPLYYEKRKYLQSIERNDLVDIHNFFFYKRILLHYLELKKTKPEGYRSYCKKIVKIIKEDKSYISKAYLSSVGNKNEAIKMKMFQMHPRIYEGFVRVNEKYLLPYKTLKASQKEPLVVIQLSGGMGNQMFQYALYLQLKALGRNVKMDDITEYEGREARPIRLSVFDARYATPTETEMKCLTDSYMDLLSKIRRKLTGRQTAAYVEKSQLFDSEVLKKERAYLMGCWQSEKYFKEAREQVREAFVFRNMKLSSKMQEYENQMQIKNSVSIHIRRGDYLQVSDVYGGICTEEYYKKAMKYMEEQISDCHFFVFTNDLEWVKERYKQSNITIVEGNDEDSGYIDMYLMTQCKHYILANSSFSWWGCYLNTSAEKIVIAPKQWFQGRDCRDIYTDEMKKIVL